MTKSRFPLAVLALLLALPAAGLERIAPGFDLWVTPADGSSYTDFAAHPIPAGFFCPGSAPFTGKVAMRGRPMSKELGSIDTVVERLDEGVFDAKGRATVRLRLKAIQLESLSPIRTSCGDFQLRAHLEGEQPITSMVVTKTSADAGFLRSTLALNLRLEFVPIGRQGAVLSLSQAVAFPRSAPIPWVNVPNAKYTSSAAWLDISGDGKADAQIPLGGTFLVGYHPDRTAAYWDGHCQISEGTCDENHNVVACSPGFICPILTEY